MSDNDFFFSDNSLLLDNAICRLVDLPVYIKGLTVKKIENYFILINAKFDIFQQRKTLLHELAHIDLGHLELDDIALKYPELEK